MCGGRASGRARCGQRLRQRGGSDTRVREREGKDSNLGLDIVLSRRTTAAVSEGCLTKECSTALQRASLQMQHRATASWRLTCSGR